MEQFQPPHVHLSRLLLRPLHFSRCQTHAHMYIYVYIFFFGLAARAGVLTPWGVAQPRSLAASALLPRMAPEEGKVTASLATT